MMLAAMGDFSENILTLINHKANKFVQDNKNWNLLFFLSHLTNFEQIKPILEDMNPMHLDRDQQTPLM